MIDSVILDWAGTMVDDIDLTLDATNATLRAFGGAPIDLATYRREFRIPVTEFYGPRTNDAALADLDRVFFDHYRRHLGELRLFDGVDLIVRLLARRGQKFFVLSTVPTEVLEPALEHFGLRDAVTAVYGGAADKRAVLPELLAEQGLERDRTLFVGDTAHDVETAQASRVRAGAALYGYSLPEDLRALSPDYAFATADDLGDMLDREWLRGQIDRVIATVGGVLAAPDGRVLLVQTKKWSGTWGIPGGKIDYGETMEAAYVREMKEEVGLEARNNRLVMIQDCIESPEFVEKRHFLLINYLSDVSEEAAPKINYELEQARWTTPTEALAMNLNKPTRALFEELERRKLLKF